MPLNFIFLKFNLKHFLLKILVIMVFLNILIKWKFTYLKIYK